MKRSTYLFAVIPLFLIACGTSKTYFTASIKRSVEASNQKLKSFSCNGQTLS